MLKEHVCQSPTFILPDPLNLFEIETDANDGSHFIAFESQKLNLSQSPQSFKEKSFIWSFTPSRSSRITYMEINFVVTTNLQSLKYFGDQSDLVVHKAVQWAELIQNFRFHNKISQIFYELYYEWP